ncbi:phytoene desaturase family protein [Bacteroidota bacterium]
MKYPNDHYSLIIIGAGITGLSAAIAYAKNHDISKNPVLVLEQHKIVGGMVTSFKRQGYLFDTSQLIPDPLELFEYLNIELDLKQFRNYFARIFLVNDGDKVEVCIPCGYDKFREMLIDRYPEDIKAINRFFIYSKAMFEELGYLTLEPGIFDLIKTLIRCPKTVINSRRTFKRYFQRFGFKNPELEAIFDVFAAFSGMPAERAIAMLTVAAMNTSVNSTFRPVKGFIQLPIAMRKQAEASGCEIVTRMKVEKILIRDKKVYGVKLEDGHEIYADQVITTVDTKVAMEKLVGLDVLEEIDSKYANKAKMVRMSTSSMTVNLGLDEKIDLDSFGMDCGYNVITTGLGTFEKLFKAFDRGEYMLDEHNFHCAVICPSLTTGGKPVIAIRIVPMPMKNWKVLRETNYNDYTREKEKVANFYISQVEKYLIPDLRQHIVVKDILTPATFERFILTPTGSNYDMAPYPGNFGLKRLKMRTPVQGLYQPKFSHGIWPSMQAGLQVVDMITGGRIMDGYSRYRKKY